MYIALDTETTGVEFYTGKVKPFFISTYTEEGEARHWEWEVNPYRREVLVPPKEREEIIDLIANKIIVFHNAKFDIRALEQVGIQVPLSPEYWEDTLMASHTCYSLPPHGLKELSILYLNVSDSDEKRLHSRVVSARNKGASLGYSLGKDPAGRTKVYYDYWMPKAVDQDDTHLSDYGSRDAQRTMELWKLYSEALTQDDLWDQYRRAKRLLPCLYAMEQGGLNILEDSRKDLLDKFEYSASTYRHKAERIGKDVTGHDFNIQSNNHMCDLLYTKLKQPVLRKTPKKNPSVDRDTLEELSEVTPCKITKTLLNNLIGFHDHVTDEYQPRYKDYYSACRYLTSYGQKQYRGVLYPSYNQTGTQTTRLSSSNPNSQNISKREGGLSLRAVFGPRDGFIWYSLDYSQLELRIFAHVSGEESLIEAFSRGEDLHDYVATRLFNKSSKDISPQERRVAKNTNFAIIYGAGKKKINETAGDPKAYQKFAKQFPNVTGFIKSMGEQTRELGYITTLGGYRLYVPSDKPYKAANYLIQGTAGDICRNAMIEIYESDLLDWDNSRIVAMIHDELLFEFPKSSDHLQDAYECKVRMESAGTDLGLVTPVDAEVITTNWNEGKEIEL